MLYNRFVTVALISGLFTFSLSFQVIEGDELYEGDDCTLTNGTSGICKKVTECSWFVPRKTERKHCSWSDDGVTEIICCKSVGTIGARSSLACQEKEPHRDYLVFHILNGKEAEIGEFPFMAALGFRNNDDSSGYAFRCGASLITKTFLLTAAHCIARGKPLVALLGTVILNESEGVLVMVKDVYKHPNYNWQTKANDIALVELDREMETNDYVDTICLHNDLGDVPDGQQLRTEGFGVTDTDYQLTSKVLLKVNQTTVPLSKCMETMENLGRKLTEKHYCAIGAEDTTTKTFGDACQGDSGGPLQIFKDDKYRLVAVTSVGIGCGTGLPGIYTRVASYIGWIESIAWP